MFRRLLSKKDRFKKGPTQLVEQDGKLVPEGTKYLQEARDMVDDIINQLSRKRTPGSLPDMGYTSKTMAGETGIKSFKGAVGKGSKIFRELAGEIQDPRYSIFNAMTNLSANARLATWMDDVAIRNKAIQDEGGRGFFWATKDLAKRAVDSPRTGIEIVEVADVIKAIPGASKLINPLADKFTTRDIAEGIKRANEIPDALHQFVRGDSKEPTAKAVSFLYRSLMLFPKAVSQISKTILSAPTHFRNFFSAGAFAGANGILFEGLTDPKLLGRAFKEGIDISGLMKFGANHPRAQEAYRELLELGVVNSQVQIGDLKNLLRDIKFGDQATVTDSILRPMMSKFKKILEWTQGKYVAEDDTWKITNFVVELQRLKRAAAKRAGKNIDDFNRTLSPDNLKTLKQEAANIVKNTVPNYAFVGSAVKTARMLPFGNFMSFPSEIFRTTTGIAEQALKEVRHSKPTKGSNLSPIVWEIGKGLVKNDSIAAGTYRTGITRLSGTAFTLAAVPIMTVEGAKAIYDVTEDEINALRQFVPEWSKNSVLVPMRDNDGNLSYIDFSHTNAYDVVARPFRTLMLNVMEGQQDDRTLLSGFVDGIGEASSEIASPFVSESIWTEAWRDVTTRGGRTSEGKELYTDETSTGDKNWIKIMHLTKALAPSVLPYERIAVASLGVPDKRGEFLELGPQLAGMVGLRPTTVDPIKSMGFKIAEYQEGIRNARREFTGGYFGILKGGRVSPNDIIDRYLASNKARFEVQKEMYKNITAAGTLGVRNIDVRGTFRDRQLSTETFNKLQKGKFDPYYPSDDIQAKIKENARNVGDPDPFIEARPILREIRRDLRSLNLFEDFDLLLNDYLFEDLGLAPAGITGRGPLQQTPVIDPSLVTQGIASGGEGGTGGVLPTGLTRTETALLSDEEKAIRLRQRGLT